MAVYKFIHSSNRKSSKVRISSSRVIQEVESATDKNTNTLVVWLQAPPTDMTLKIKYKYTSVNKRESKLYLYRPGYVSFSGSSRVNWDFPVLFRPWRLVDVVVGASDGGNWTPRGEKWKSFVWVCCYDIIDRWVTDSPTEPMTRTTFDKQHLPCEWLLKAVTNFSRVWKWNKTIYITAWRLLSLGETI